MNALRLAVAELNLDGVPAHAAVDGAVRLASAGKGRHLAGMVNAVARRVAEGGAALWDARGGGGVAGLAGRSRSRMPGGRRRWLAIAEAHRRAAPIDLTLKRPGGGGGLGRRARGGAAADRQPAACRAAAGVGAAGLRRGRVVGAGRGGGAAGAAAGRARRQAGARRLRRAGGQDAAARGGGGGGDGARRLGGAAGAAAGEPRAHRARRAGGGGGRAGLDAGGARSRRSWWTRPARPAARSGGTRTCRICAPGASSGRSSRLQAALLARAWDVAAPGGRLVYCVCSLLPAEGEAQVARFLAAAPGARVVAPDAAALGVEPGWIDGAGRAAAAAGLLAGARRNGRLLRRLPREAGRCRVTSRRGAAIRAGQT